VRGGHRAPALGGLPPRPGGAAQALPRHRPDQPGRRGPRLLPALREARGQEALGRQDAGVRARDAPHRECPPRGEVRPPGSRRTRRRAVGAGDELGSEHRARGGVQVEEADTARARAGAADRALRGDPLRGSRARHRGHAAASLRVRRPALRRGDAALPRARVGAPPGEGARPGSRAGQGAPDGGGPAREPRARDPAAGPGADRAVAHRDERRGPGGVRGAGRRPARGSRIRGRDRGRPACDSCTPPAPITDGNVQDPCEALTTRSAFTLPSRSTSPFGHVTSSAAALAAPSPK
jgi:hypothetical protein